MKRVFSLLATCALLFSCVKEEVEEIVTTIFKYIFYEKTDCLGSCNAACLRYFFRAAER